ncbi:MAG: molybdopterin-dependent oxidoreductase [Gemmatimonadetes bacterium]|nr:molybdopterin-dependent oxidoreductase [Gemmatimonadota bacterium]
MSDFNVVNVSRRDVLKTLGLATGFVVSSAVVPKGIRALANRALADGILADRLEPSVYLALDTDGMVQAYIHRVEMGQGARTGLKQILADELEANWDRIHVVPAFGDLKFGSQNTDGSTSIRMFYDAFRMAGATARHMLEDAAAAEWGVARDQVEATDHKILNKVTGRSQDYRDFVAAAALLTAPAAESVTLKTRAQHRYIGKPVRNLHMEEFATGSSIYGQDVRREGMVYAVAARPPSVGGKLTGYNREAALAVSGVLDVVELPEMKAGWGFQPLGGVAVIATNTWAAIQGRKALAASFDGGPNGSFDTTEYEASLWRSIDAGGEETYARGDVDTALAGSARRITADYFVPFQHHAPMEPPAATAEWIDGKLNIWTSCQDPQAVQNTVAPYVGVAAEDIYVEATLLGGAFGRKSKPDFAVEAAVLATHAQRPVKMIWTREDDVQHGFYHAISAQRVDVGLDASGRVQAWDHRAAYPSLMETATGQQTDAATSFEVGPVMEQPLVLPHMRIRSGEAKAHVRVGWLRSVTSIQHAFAMGSMIDEIAEVTGRRPDEVWQDLFGSVLTGADLTDASRREPRPLVAERLGAVLRRVTEMSGYGRALPPGTGIGLAAFTSFGSFTAAALEVSVSEDGEVHVPRAWTAIDCGLAVSPERVTSQMEGAVVFGLTIALHGAITVKHGAVEQDNFDGYQVCRINEAPEVEVAIFENEHPLGGAGEPGVPPVAAALSNGIFAAVGKRIRRLPVGDQLKG